MNIKTVLNIVKDQDDVIAVALTKDRAFVICREDIYYCVSTIGSDGSIRKQPLHHSKSRAYWDMHRRVIITTLREEWDDES